MTNPAKRETWKDLCRRTQRLCQVSYLHALKYEPHPGAPGLDIDAIHFKLGAVRK